MLIVHHVLDVFPVFYIAAKTLTQAVSAYYVSSEVSLVGVDREAFTQGSTVQQFKKAIRDHLLFVEVGVGISTYDVGIVGLNSTSGACTMTVSDFLAGKLDIFRCDRFLLCCLPDE